MAPTITVGGLSSQARVLLARGAAASAARLTRRQEDNPDVSESDPDVKVDPTGGITDPHDINNVGFYFLFAIIGVSIVMTMLWFFFWSKNGGFVFQKNDWDDYKSTVLRRRGPNGTVLSGATKSTNLGGGSVYKDVDDGTTVITEATGLSGITAGASDVAAREKRKRKQERRDREREKRRSEKGSSSGGGNGNKPGGNSNKPGGRRHHGNDGVVIDEEAEKAAQEQLRSYRNEKAACVGGLNTKSDGSVWDGSTNPTLSVASSEAGGLLQNRETTPNSSPSKRHSASAAAAAAAAISEKRSSSHRRDHESSRDKERRDRDSSKDKERRDRGSPREKEHRDKDRKDKDRKDRDRKDGDGKREREHREHKTETRDWAEKQEESAVAPAASSSSSAPVPRTGGGIRKVYSTADKRDSREAQRIRAEAKRLQERGRAAKATSAGGPSSIGESGVSGEPAAGGGHRREFSWSKTQESDRMLEAPEPVETRRGRIAGGSELPPGSWVDSVVSEESGTKSYYHPMPELTAMRSGYRRGRTEDYDE